MTNKEAPVADRYDKLLTDYFNGTLDKHVASYKVSDMRFQIGF
ncbi:Protein of unknown function [Weissella confusa LBAE C39-2]|nr:Protein of unknown function [Weissella confusa LBAE C39-2]